MSNDPTAPIKNGPVSQNLLSCLVVQDAPGVSLPAQRWPLHGPLVSVGRATDNQIVIAHNSVSREHARFELRDGRWWVKSLQPSKNPVYLGGIPVHDAAPIASTDVITIGVVVFQFIEPQSQSLKETLPYPLAIAMGRVEAASGSERRLKAAMLGTELLLRFLFSAQVGALFSIGRQNQITSLLPRDFKPNNITMGMWSQLVFKFAPAVQKENNPLRPSLNSLQKITGDWGTLQQRIDDLVKLRNNLMHRWFGEEDAFEDEARKASSELQTLVLALVPLRALSMVSWLPTDGSPTAEGWPVRLLQGTSAQFPIKRKRLLGAIVPYWCYLVDDTGSVLPLYPCFALATSQQTRHLELFVSRSLLTLQAGEALLMDGLTCSHEINIPVPPNQVLPNFG